MKEARTRMPSQVEHVATADIETYVASEAENTRSQPDSQPLAKNPYDGNLLEEAAKRFSRMVASWHLGGAKRRKVEKQMALGRSIREARQSRNMSRESLSEKTGLAPGVLFLLENGLLSPSETDDALGQVIREIDVDFANSASR